MPPQGTRQQVAMVLPPSAPPVMAVVSAPGGSGGFHLISRANAAEAAAAPRHGGATPGPWAVQVGAFSNQGQAQAAVHQAKAQAQAELSIGRPFIGGVKQAHGTLYRARLTGLSRETAVQACEALAHGRTNCIVLSPDAQL